MAQFTKSYEFDERLEQVYREVKKWSISPEKVLLKKEKKEKEKEKRKKKKEKRK